MSRPVLDRSIQIKRPYYIKAQPYLMAHPRNWYKGEYIVDPVAIHYLGLLGAKGYTFNFGMKPWFNLRFKWWGR